MAKSWPLQLPGKVPGTRYPNKIKSPESVHSSSISLPRKQTGSERQAESPQSDVKVSITIPDEQVK